MYIQCILVKPESNDWSDNIFVDRWRHHHCMEFYIKPEYCYLKVNIFQKKCHFCEICFALPTNCQFKDCNSYTVLVIFRFRCFCLFVCLFQGVNKFRLHVESLH